MPKHVLAHLQTHDPMLYEALSHAEHSDTLTPSVQKDLFASLCRIIVGQQLSGKAADAIWKKFRAPFPRNRPTAKAILARTEDELRASGISFAKVRSVKDLSEKVARREIVLSRLRHTPENDVRKVLQTVVGIGPWTCEMFLMFSLGREDVFSPGDLGLRKGMKKVYGFSELPDTALAERISHTWRPYRTYASCALWHILDNR